MTLTNLQGDRLTPDVYDSPSLLDNSLTSLSWLQNLRVPDLLSASAPAFLTTPGDSDVEEFSDCCSSSSPETAKKEAGVSLSPIRKCLLQSVEFRSKPRKYRSKSDKPPFGYTTLIYLAVRNSTSGRATLNEICRWIKENFKYYKVAEPSWQNSIRHNLSLNEMFVKARRLSGQSGKACYWTISPEYENILCEENEAQILDHSYSKTHASKYVGVHPRKRAHSQSCVKSNKKSRSRGSSGKTHKKKRVKSESVVPADPCGLPGDLNWVSLLSSQRLTCGACPSQACRPAFGSPILGPPDLGHIGEPIICSPLVVPMTLTTTQLPETPVLGENKGALLEEAVLKQDSPSPQLLPWANSQTSNTHPWAESKDTTLHELRTMCKRAHPTLAKRSQHWSPESSWSSGCSTSSSTRYARTAFLPEACI